VGQSVERDGKLWYRWHFPEDPQPEAEWWPWDGVPFDHCNP
jgi:hypothetical protein